MKNSKVFHKLFCTVLATLITVSIISNSSLLSFDVNADSQVSINETNFPDPVFRQYVADSFDIDGNGSLSISEIRDIISINVSCCEISDLKGIEYFFCLLYLNCAGNNLTTLDISKNSSLLELECGANKLSNLDVSYNTDLINLWCYDNQLKTLDVSKNTALQNLDCGSNQLTSLDVSKNTSLVELLCQINQLTTLDISKNTSLVNLHCSQNQLTTLDVSNNTELCYLYCDLNQLTSIDLSANTSLHVFSCSINQLTALDISNNTELEALVCETNQLTTLDVSENTGLGTLFCGGNQLASLDLSNNNISTLSCSFNQLKELDVTHCPSLDSLNCENNQLSNLDITKNPHLTYLNCGHNQLSNLYLYYNTELTALNCYNNRLTSLNLSNKFSLETLNCSNNQLASLNLSGCVQLAVIDVNNNELTELNIDDCSMLNSLNCFYNYLTVRPNVEGLFFDPQKTLLTITNQPKDYTGTAGSTATFSVTAQGDELAYQWQVCSNGVWKTTAASGANTPTISFKISDSHNGKKYRCLVMDGYDKHLFSREVTVHVGIPLEITSNPLDHTGVAGSTATFGVTAQGTGLAYQWQVYSNGTWKNTAASGANTSKISFKITDAHDGMKYRCVVTDAFGQQLVSRVAVLHVGVPLAIKSQPKNYTGLAGSTATFSVTAQGTDLTYQWLVYSDGAWINSGANGSKTSSISFNISHNHNGKRYRCVITDRFGRSVVSNAATVTVSTPLVFTKQPSNYTGLAGSTATFSVIAKGTDVTYQWQVYSNGAWVNSGATGAKTSCISFNVKSEHNGKQYRCVISDCYGQKKLSNVAKVVVMTPLTITKQPVNYTGAAGSTATFSVTASGTGLTYQWQVYSDGAWNNSGAKGSKTSSISFNVNNNNNGKKYRCVITDSYGQKVTSNTVTVKVATPPSITKQPSNYVGVAGSTASFSVTASGTGLKYQWQVYSDGVWCNSGATGSKTSSISFNVNTNSNGKKYRCVITDSYGQKVTSNVVSVRVATSLTITKQPVNYSGLAGSTASFGVTASGTGLKYQWQVYSNGAWSNSGATGANTNKISFKVSSSHNGMKYRCVITDSYGQKVTTNTVSVRITTAATNYAMPADNSVEFDTTSPVIINNAAVSGVIGTEDELITATDMEETNALINDRIDGVESEEIEDKILIPVLEEPVNAEEEEVTENKLSLDGQQAVYSDVEETVDDEIAKGPSILKQPSEYKGKAGEKASFTVEAEGQGLRYQWQYCKNGEWINLDVEGADTTELILEITTADNGMKYRCVITDFLGYSVMTDVVTVYAITAK